MTNHTDQTIDQLSFTARAAAGWPVPTLVRREDLEDTTIVVVAWYGIWTAIGTCRAEDRLIDPEGNVIDLIAAHESGSWPTSQHQQVANAIDFFLTHED